MAKTEVSMYGRANNLIVKQGMNYSAIARELGLGVNYFMYYMKRAKKAMLTNSQLVKLAEILGTTPDKIVGYEVPLDKVKYLHEHNMLKQTPRKEYQHQYYLEKTLPKRKALREGKTK